ncbi:MAG: MATE family efflux transporter [Sphaerochaetaceae bacterium]|nr:MATE family efflux transporter [Sphaerochaetaceae bacterium]
MSDEIAAKSRIKVFTEGPILGPLLSFAFPILAASFLQSLYGAVDMLIVGQFSDAAAVSAVSTGSNIMNTITQVFVGISMGTTVLLGQKIGEGKRQEAGLITGSSIALFAAIAIAATAIFVIFSNSIAQIMQAPAEALESTVSYIRICSSGCLFIVAYNLLGSIFRGIGDSRMPLITVAISSVLNIFGDLLLVAKFSMGASGAAIATVVSQAVSVLLSVLIIRRRGLPFEFKTNFIKWNSNIIKKVLKFGFPVALQDLLVSLSFLVIAAIVNSLGVTASAGVGIAEKVCAFIMLVPSSFSQAMSAFVAQNAGACKPDRAIKALRYGIGVSLCLGVLIGWFTFFHGDILAGLFSHDSALIAAAWDYLKAYSIDCILVSVLFCSTGYFNGYGRTRFVMIEGITGAFGVRIPVAFAMSRIKPVSLFHVGLSTPCATVIQIILCMIYLMHMRCQQKKQ